MKRAITVLIGDSGRTLGTLRFDVAGARESAAFAYDSAWLASADAFSIDADLPLVNGFQFHKKLGDGSVFHSAFADTEPDGWGKRVILRDHAKQRQRGGATRKSTAPLHALDFLLAVDDFSRIGALRFQDEEGVFQRAPDSGRRTAPPFIELAHLLQATRAVESNTDTDADLAYLRGRGTSLGGMRPKCTVLDQDGQLSIGKFPSVADERAVTKGEVLALNLASAAGINAASARIVESDGLAVALVRRFDREEGGGRLLYVSAATLLGVDPAVPEEASYTDIVDAIRTYGSHARDDIEELWRRIAFSILITNVDDHLLNHGFLSVGRGLWRLAPAFDLNPFPDRLRELKTWLSPDTGPAASIAPLLSLAPYFQISASRAKQILDEVEKAVSQWREQGRALGMTTSELSAFETAFEHEERRKRLPR